MLLLGKKKSRKTSKDYSNNYSDHTTFILSKHAVTHKSKVVTMISKLVSANKLLVSYSFGNQLSSVFITRKIVYNWKQLMFRLRSKV